MRRLLTILEVVLLVGSIHTCRSQLSLFESDLPDNSSNPEWLAPASLDLGSTIVHEAVDLSAAEEQAVGHDEAKSLEDMLHWAISNSDPEKLKQRAEEVQTHNAVHDLLKTRDKIKELHEYMKQQPTETELLTEAIGILNDVEESVDLKRVALSRLQELVEPIDNANDLKTLNGIAPVVSFLSPTEPRLAAEACYVLGTAASNNPTFQQHLYEEYPLIFEMLLDIIKLADAATTSKCLYSISSLIRNTPELRTAFLAANGLHVVSTIFRIHPQELRLNRKALDLFADLAQLEPGALAKFLTSPAGSSFVQSLLSLVLQNDLDLQEKSLIALRTLASSHQNRQVMSLHGATPVLEAACARLTGQHVGQSDDQYFEYVSGLCDAVSSSLKVDQRLEL